MGRIATKCSCQLKHFVELQNLPRCLMNKFNGQYKNCHIPMISAASLRQDKVLGRGGTRGGGGDIASLDGFYLWNFFSLIFIFPNDMPALYHSATIGRGIDQKLFPRWCHPYADPTRIHYGMLTLNSFSTNVQ